MVICIIIRCSQCEVRIKSSSQYELYIMNYMPKLPNIPILVTPKLRLNNTEKASGGTIRRSYVDHFSCRKTARHQLSREFGKSPYLPSTTISVLIKSFPTASYEPRSTKIPFEDFA